jgi:leucyl aminopeptidase
MPLKIQLATGTAARSTTEVVAIGVTQGDLKKQPLLTELDQALGGALLEQAALAEFAGKAEQIFELATLGKIEARRVVLVGLGPKAGVDVAGIRTYAALAARSTNAANARTLGLVVTDDEHLRAIGEGTVLGAYRFTKYFTGERAPKTGLNRVDVIRDKKARAPDVLKRALALGVRVGEAVCIARDAVNEPPNELTPAVLADLARRIARQNKLKISVLEKNAIAASGMKLLYAVGQGSANEPRFIHVRYVPSRAKKKLVFVGKGLTFDSGGLCIKPAPGMGEMKSDMGGAAAVLALMAAVAAVGSSVEGHALVASAENMPDGAAYRPGDVFGSLDGKTVEIINTDAEGRLVLADALAYARKLDPDLIVDAATLTGACVVALGKTCSAFYTDDDSIARQMETAARKAGEAFWRMPLLEDLVEQLKSDVADLKHTGDRWGGSITAALFLREFVGKTPWMHCDVAGAVLADKSKGVYPKGGTGHPVLTFLNFVESFE